MRAGIPMIGEAWEVCSGKRGEKLSEAYRRIWDMPKRPELDRSKPCVHLGESTGELRECPSCGTNKDGKATVKIFLMSCAIHGKCTPVKQIDGVKCCMFCADYKPPEP